MFNGAHKGGGVNVMLYASPCYYYHIVVGFLTPVGGKTYFYTLRQRCVLNTKSKYKITLIYRHYFNYFISFFMTRVHTREPLFIRLQYNLIYPDIKCRLYFYLSRTPIRTIVTEFLLLFLQPDKYKIFNEI